MSNLLRNINKSRRMTACYVHVFEFLEGGVGVGVRVGVGLGGWVG